MRYIASVYATDTRPERPETKNPEKPKGGWRTKSGKRRLGNRAQIDAESLGEAMAKVAALIGKLKSDVQSQIVSVQIEADSTSGDGPTNPFAEK